MCFMAHLLKKKRAFFPTCIYQLSLRAGIAVIFAVQYKKGQEQEP